MLNPVFSIAHMRRMGTCCIDIFSSAITNSLPVPTFYEVVDKVSTGQRYLHIHSLIFTQLRDTLEAKAKQGPVEVSLGTSDTCVPAKL